MKPNEDALLPLPARIAWTTAAFSFGAEVRCQTGAALGAHTEQLMEELWYNFSMNGSSLRVRETDVLGPFQMVVTAGEELPEMPELAAGEEYAISVTEHGAAVSAKDQSGMLHGFFTLLQLIRAQDLRPGQEALSIPGVSILDHPAVGFRCLHLCVFPETTLPFLHKVVRLAGLLKFSHVILEFWGMLRFDCMAELSWPAAYAKEQIRPILADARSMGVEPIPMFNHLGHASGSRAIYGRHVVLDQNPRLATLFEPDGWTWCLSNPETLELLKAVRSELIQLFGQGAYFHIGCDEAYSFATCDRCRESDSRRMLLEYLNGLAEELGKMGRRPIMWGDMLLDATAWPSPIIAVSRPDQRTHEILDDLDRRIIIADWQYSILDSKLPSTEHFMSKGFDVAPCPWHDSENILALGQGAAELGVFGFMPTTWHTLPEHIRLIPVSAEAGWCGQKKRSLHAGIATLAGSLQRKVFPAHSDYLAAGFRRLEVIE